MLTQNLCSVSFALTVCNSKFCGSVEDFLLHVIQQSDAHSRHFHSLFSIIQPSLSMSPESQEIVGKTCIGFV